MVQLDIIGTVWPLITWKHITEHISDISVKALFILNVRLVFAISETAIFFLSEKRIKDIQSLNEHMQSIIDSKTQLKTRLQQPFVGDYVKIEAQYHKYVIYTNKIRTWFLFFMPLNESNESGAYSLTLLKASELYSLW